MIEEIEKLILKLLNIVDNKQLNYDEELSNNIFLRLNHALTFLEKYKAKRNENENINNDKNYIKNREKNIISEKKYSSQKWEELINKIDILKQLINEDRIFETSIVYDDIQQMLAKFDPKQYFPEIFFPLYATLSPHIKDIHKNIDKFSNTIQWYMSKKMYNIDYSSFLKERTCINENNIINSPQEIIDNYFYPKTSSVANELEYNDDKKIAGCIDDLIDNTEISDEFTKK
ncbi:hypothetical protein IBE11_09280 [Francisella tularensis subsp. novicida]|nr:hypothetical protein [Francisella tularensis subsp. novicida]MBK2350634.1 hypothetical protein [Francisella tularensis subsp. novicida]MBK2354192.1 hypothetical protein [Francisella tularensis subsp. novicida]MBK2355982.1 hypothetical protein [Francisella tularensis subsp. novicida]MBK2359605.1 hypothetical protein [Francisella tularensis subsp. novicida]